MTKAPAFQFYPDDFVGGAAGLMTPEEVGVYTLLLCLDWNQTGFVFEPAKLARWCRIQPKRFLALWEGSVSLCFVERDGRLFNPRLEQERAKQEHNRIARQAAAQARWGANADANGHANALHTESLPFPSPIPSPDVVVVSGQSDDGVSGIEAPTDLGNIAILLTAAANQGITAKYGEQPNPIRHMHPGGAEMAATLKARGVPVMFARDAIYTAATRCTLKRPPQSLKYFLNQVLDAWDAEMSRRQAASSPVPNAIPMNGDRKAVSLSLNRAKMLGGN